MKIHFVGISGVSMQALASIAAAHGHIVTGSDRDHGGHDAANVDGCDLVVYTCAVPKDNCELKRAAELGIPMIERAQYLGELSAAYGSVVAVAGCHGKSTTSAMLGAAFMARRPTLHVGVAGGSKVGADKYFITEACEYRANFLHLHPTVGVVLNVGYDHPDFYRTEEQLIDAYKQFCRNSRTVIVNGDDNICRNLSTGAITFGMGRNCDYRAVDIKNENGLRTFMLTGKRQARVRLSVAGEHNIYNALATIAATCESGLSLTESLVGISRFTGLPRRFERRGIAFNKTVFTDYAHHPDEISATIRTAKELFPSVAVIFQPHTYTRTRSMMDEFATALGAADTVILAPIFSAREAPIDGVTSQALTDKIIENNKKAYCLDSFDEIVEFAKTVRDKAVIFMGAGDINLAADMFIAAGRYANA